MSDDEYEILPHQLLGDLKDEVEALKKKLNQPDTKINELLLEIESLKDSIHDLTGIFQKAIEVSKDEDPTAKIQKLQERIEEVINQNETIAKGMIAISDKLENFMGLQQQTSNRMAAPSSVSHTMGVPPTMAGVRTAPMPDMGVNASMPSGLDIDLPPPPPRMKNSADKRKSISGIFN